MRNIDSKRTKNNKRYTAKSSSNIKKEKGILKYLLAIEPPKHTKIYNGN